MLNFSHKFHQDIASISKADWQQCFCSTQPFVQYEFLKLLEVSGCVGAKTGWQVCHLEVFVEQDTVALMPLYIKSHSYGEYLFDWSWADAYHRNGIDYYPKLVSAIPYTPVTGKRLGIAKSFLPHAEQVLQFVTLVLKALASQIGVQTSQILFLTKSQQELVDQHKSWLPRSDIQYHWFNKNYRTFDDFLDTLTARKRKNIKRERALVLKQGVEIVHVLAKNVTEDTWVKFFDFYQSTYIKRSGHKGYLNLAFFTSLTEVLPANATLTLAYCEKELIAGALFFHDDQQLYGRYWGATEHFDFLHFELCYYQGIERCISLGLARFNAGAQGQHKIKRGFEPVYVYGCYQIYHPAFHAAIDDFLKKEQLHNQLHFERAQSALPYKQD